jgi:PAS domain S-box-containing protein
VTPEQFLEFAKLLPEPVLLVTGNGQILATNPSFSQMLGLNRQILQGKLLFELVSNPLIRSNSIYAVALAVEKWCLDH